MRIHLFILVLLVTGLAISSVWAQSDQSLAWDNWAGGTWQGAELEVSASSDILTLKYVIGEAPDAWPHAEITFPEAIDISTATGLQYDVRITLPEGRKAPVRSHSVLVGNPWGASWQQDTPPLPVKPGEWVPEGVNLLLFQPLLAQNVKRLQFFVWNRDWHNAGFQAGDVVIFELRRPQLTGVREKRDGSVFKQAPLQRMLGKSGSLTAWSEPVDSKVQPDFVAPEDTPSAIELEAARNEYADFQVALRSDQKLDTVKVQVTPPCRRGEMMPVPGFTIQTRLEGYVKTERPSAYYSKPGLYPDPLLFEDTVTLQPDETRALWINMYVSENVPAGDYEGQILVTAADGSEIVAGYLLKVYNFTLPKTPALPTAFQLAFEQGWSHMLDYYPEADETLFRSLWESMAKARIAPMHLGPSGPPRQMEGPGWEQYQRYVAMVKEFNFNGIGPFYWGPPVETPEDRDWVRKMTDYYEKEGLLDRMYVYMAQYDEASPERYPALREYATKLKETEPRLPRFITVPPHPDLYGAIDWWCPGTPFYRKDIARERRAAGDKVWWYTCVQWSPGLLIDHSGTEHRALLWLTYTQEADGLLFWCIDFYPRNPWETPEMGPGTAGNGDGYLIYPRREGDPKDRFYETVRLQVLRESIEDYDALIILRDRLKTAEASGNASQAALKAAKDALTAVERVATTVGNYSMDAPDYQYVRHLVYEAIEKL